MTDSGVGLGLTTAPTVCPPSFEKKLNVQRGEEINVLCDDPYEHKRLWKLGVLSAIRKSTGDYLVHVNGHAPMWLSPSSDRLALKNAQLPSTVDEFASQPLQFSPPSTKEQSVGGADSKRQETKR